MECESEEGETEAVECAGQLKNTRGYEYKSYIDILNIFACISVIGIHCNAGFNTFENSHRWVLATFLNACYYWANGMFVMICGANLLDYRERYDTKTFFRRRILRTFIPFVVWSLIAVCVRIFIGKENLLGGGHKLNQFFYMLLNNNCIYNGVYWFFYMLFALYLSIPVISLIPYEKRKRIFGYLIWISFFMNAFLPSVCQLILHWNWNDNLTISMTRGMGIYLFLGYYLDRYEVKCKKMIVGFGFAAFLALWLVTCVLSFQYEKLWTGLCGWYNFPAILLCTSVFLIFKGRLSKVSDKVRFHLRKISSASLGVYCIHMFFVWWIPVLFQIDNRNIDWMVLGPVGVYCLSLLVVLPLKKVKLINRLLVP